MFLVFVFVCLGFVFVYFALFLFCSWIVFGALILFALGVSSVFWGFCFCVFLFVLLCLCWSVF